MRGSRRRGTHWAGVLEEGHVSGRHMTKRETRVGMSRGSPNKGWHTEKGRTKHSRERERSGTLGNAWEHLARSNRLGVGKGKS